MINKEKMTHKESKEAIVEIRYILENCKLVVELFQEYCLNFIKDSEQKLNQMEKEVEKDKTPL